MNNFTDKLNFIPGNIYTVEEEVKIVGGVYENDLIHDNIAQDTIAVFTGSKCTGKRINSYAISTPSLAPWKTHIKIFTSEKVVYVTYETVGDTVEADDINSVQDAINDTQKALKDETTRATNAENTLTINLNAEITRAKKAENTLQTNINNEVKRAKKAESDEATRATNAENTITSNLNTEITRAKKAENTLTTNLNNEITRAKKAESDEVTRATNAEKTLTDNLNKEISRATNAENGIKNTINTNKPKWDDKYTKNEIDNKLSSLIMNVTWKDAVATSSDLATTYPSPQLGWTVYVDDSGYTYRYDGSSWIKISSYNIPLATASHDGRMSKEDKSFLDTVKSKWSSITSHIADTVKHITSAERTKWNTVDNKVNKSGDTMTGALSIKKSGDNATLLTFDTERPWSFKQGSTGASSTLDLVSSSGDKSFRVLNVDKTKGLDVHTSPTKTQVTIDGNKIYHAGDKPKLSELTNDAGFITSADIDTSQNHVHTNMTVLNKITQNSLDNWNDGARRIVFVGSDAENTNGWYKVAEQTCSGYGDTNITFMVTSTYSNYNVGILQLQIRSDSSSISCRTLKWLNRIGLNVDHYVVVISGMKWTLYAYQPCSRYGRIAFEILSMSSINNKDMGWTLNFANNNTKETTAPVATVTSSDGSSVGYATSATKATQDSDGKQINTTYVKKGMTWNQLEGK